MADSDGGDGNMAIRHQIYGCLITGNLPGPFMVTDGAMEVGLAETMGAAVQVAKQRWREAASVFDEVPRVRTENTN